MQTAAGEQGGGGSPDERAPAGPDADGALPREHQGQQGKFNFSGEMTIGNIQSRTALRLIREWAVLHQAELQANWEQTKTGQPLNGIAPLE